MKLSSAEQARLSTAAHGSPHTQALPAGPAPAVPGYELAELIGRGGMGDVYRATDLDMDRPVAVKILQQRFAVDSPAALRFVEEARITGQLQHPGIPAVYRIGRLADGRPFLAMKLIKGHTLEELLKSHRPVNHLALMEAVAQALGYAHAHEVIHRDLKPANIMVGAFGEVQVMDWGLAKVLAGRPQRNNTSADPEATTALTMIQMQRDSSYTQAGSVLGTPAYMPPEQAAGETERIGKASDVFGLGALWCKLLTGQPPFTGADAEAVRRNALRGRTEEALARLDGCGAEPEVVALCKQCLALEPADRPADATVVARRVAELRVAAEERARQAQLAQARAEVHTAEQAKRRRVLQWAGGVVAAVLLLGMGGTSVGLYWANQARQTAEAAQGEADAKRQAAEVAQQHEAEQRREAVAQAKLATAVKTFLQRDVLQLADPATQQQQGTALKYDAEVRLCDVVLRAAEKIEGKFADQPLVEAEIRFTLGFTLLGMGRPELALKQYERVLTLRKQHLGPDQPDTLQSMNNLANSYADLGRHAEALKLHQETLALQKARLGPDHPDTLQSMNNLANSYAALGRRAEALKLLQETLALQKTKLGPDHPDTLVSMHNLASSYWALGRQAEAHKLFQETLALRKAKLGPDHPHTLGSMDNLANSYWALGQQAEALKLHQETLALRKAKLGPDHPDTLVSMNNLAVTYGDLGRQAEALKLHQETLALRKAKLGPDHPDTLLSEWGVIALLVALQRPDEALVKIDALLARADHITAAGKHVHPRLLPQMFSFRLPIYKQKNDAAGCRATAELWEKRVPRSAGELYDAACFRAVTAAVLPQDPRTPAADAAQLAQQEADRAMHWLRKAVAAGFTNRAHMERDGDLDSLRSRDDFRELLDSLPRK